MLTHNNVSSCFTTVPLCASLHSEVMSTRNVSTEWLIATFDLDMHAEVSSIRKEILALSNPTAHPLFEDVCLGIELTDTEAVRLSSRRIVMYVLNKREFTCGYKVIL